MRRRRNGVPYARELHLHPGRASDSLFDPCAGLEHQPFRWTHRGFYAQHCQVCGRRLGGWYEEGTDKPLASLRDTDNHPYLLERPL